MVNGNELRIQAIASQTRLKIYFISQPGKFNAFNYKF